MNAAKIYAVVILIFMLSACNESEENEFYCTKFHWYEFNVTSNPLILPASYVDTTFQIKDREGNIGGIYGVHSITAINKEDTTYISNTALQGMHNDIISDTIKTEWFTIINEEKRRIRIILHENKEIKSRFVDISIWPINYKMIADEIAASNTLQIYQKAFE